MLSRQYTDRVKIFTRSEVMAKVVRGAILKDFPRLTVETGKESPKENPSLTDVVVISGFYNSCVEPATDLIVSLAIKAKAVLYVLFDKDRVGNTHSPYDWSRD